jgi:hypothetical protein
MAFTASDLISQLQNKLVLMKYRQAHPARRNALVRGVLDGLNVGRWLLDRDFTEYKADLGTLLLTDKPLPEVLVEVNAGIDRKAWIPATLFTNINYRTGKEGPADYADGVAMGYYHVVHLYLAYLGYAKDYEAIRMTSERLPFIVKEIESLSY